MHFPEPVRMPDDHAGPVWARARKRPAGGGGGGFVGLLVTLLALFGVLTGVLGVKERSLAEGGAIMDGWIVVGVAAAQRLAGQVSQAVGATSGRAGEASAGTGDALDAGAATTADTRKAS